jgi:hypothetical protein
MDSAQVKAMLKRIKLSEPEFIEYLTDLSKQNYEAFKNDPSELNDIHKGYAMAIDKLTESFTECEKEEVKKDVEDIATMHY